MNFEDSVIFKKKAKIIERHGEELLLFDSSQGILFDVNETAKKIWLLIDGTKNLKNIKEQLKVEFEDSKDIDKDLTDFLKELLELEMIEKLE